MSGISTSKAIAYLRNYQKWRRGEIDEPQPEPLKLGACIDVVIDAAESAELAKSDRNKEHVHTNRAANLLAECRNLRNATPGNWTGEPVLPGWMICRIDNVLKSIPAYSKHPTQKLTRPPSSAARRLAPCWMRDRSVRRDDLYRY